MRREEEEEERTPDTEPRGYLEPPRRRPPTAIGAALTPSGNPPRPLRITAGPERRESLLFRALLGIAQVLEEARRMVRRVVNG
jgi:hypothetical protein